MHKPDRTSRPVAIHRSGRRLIVSAAILIAAWGLGSTRAQGSPIPFQQALESLDDPHPHGPGDGLLVDHQPHNTGGLASDTMAFEIPGGSIVAQYVADDFQLAGPSTVRRIKYHGFYNYGIEPAGGETFAIKFHEPRPGDGLPGNVLYETTATNPLREWTGRLVLALGGARIRVHGRSGFTFGPARRPEVLAVHLSGRRSNLIFSMGTLGE